jgi:hypothetical protein
MKTNKIVLLCPPGKWTSSLSIKALREFSVLFFIYVALNLLSSYLHEGDLLREVLNEEIKDSILYKMGRFPFSSLLSIGLILSFLIICFVNRKISMWLLSENNANYSKIISLELITFSYFLFFLIVVLLISLIILYFKDISYLEYFLLINSIFSFGFGLVLIQLYRYLKYSRLWFQESTFRAFLIYLAPYFYVYLFIKMGV